MSTSTTSQREPAPRPGVRAGLAGVAVLVLALGVLVYVVARPAGSAWLLPAQWQAARSGPVAAALPLGAVAQWLPSFAHAFGFSMLTALVLPLRPGCVAVACTGWATVDSLAEFAQHPAAAGTVAAALESAFGGAPWAVQVGRYFTRGSFDFADLAAGVAGCALAGSVLHFVLLRRKSLRGTCATGARLGPQGARRTGGPHRPGGAVRRGAR